MTDDEVKRFQKIIEGPIKDTLTKEYPEYMQKYMYFRKTTGPQCPICKAGAKMMFNLESQRLPDFMTRWQDNNWKNYG